MRLVRLVLVLVLVAVGAGSAAAKDVCVVNSVGPVTYFFRNVRIPKPGKLAPIAGVAALSYPRVQPGIVHGTVYGQSNGLLRVGVLVQGLLPQGYAVDHIFDTASVDKLFTGANFVVLSNDSTASGTWTAVNCKLLTIP